MFPAWDLNFLRTSYPPYFSFLTRFWHTWKHEKNLIWYKCRDVLQSVHAANVNFCCHMYFCILLFCFFYLFHALIPLSPPKLLHWLWYEKNSWSVLTPFNSEIPSWQMKTVETGEEMWFFFNMQSLDQMCSRYGDVFGLPRCGLFAFSDAWFLFPYFSKCHGIVVISPLLVACPFLNVPSIFIHYNIHMDSLLYVTVTLCTLSTIKHHPTFLSYENFVSSFSVKRCLIPPFTPSEKKVGCKFSHFGLRNVYC